MNKQTFAVVVAAALLLALGVFGAMAFTGGSDDGAPIMTMPDGTTMPSDQMKQNDGTHMMDDGQTMTGMDMNP